MKELSIEQKAKAYDEAIEKAKAWCDCENATTDDKILLKRILPELVESDDERIRKGIIKSIMDLNTDWLELHGVTKENTLAWLEKQGEHANFRNKIQIGDKVTRNRDGVLVNLSQLNRVAKKDEKQGEQKPDDKVEPKFYGGEWVVTDKNNVVQIKAIENSKYVLENTMRFSVDYVDKCWRKWTIKDAKDGDVLYARGSYFKEYAFIYSGMTEDNVLSTYCGFDMAKNNFDTKLTRFGRVEDFEIVCPAAKEQRDTLMKAMTDAGYTFDFEKKELKKIEQEWEPQPGDTFRKRGTDEPLYCLCGLREDGINYGFVEEREVGIAGGTISKFALKSEYELVERHKTLDKILEETIVKPIKELTNQEVTKESDKELTGFEKAVLDIIPDHRTHTDSVEEFARRNASRLLSIARKQIANEINVDAMAEKYIAVLWHTYPKFIIPIYKQGIEDTLKAIKGE